MFIGVKHTSGYDRDGQQVAAGFYLLLFNRNWTKHIDKEYEERRLLCRALRAAVRYIHLSQLGHFMMGSTNVGKHRITVSGPYGADGLPLDIPQTPDGKEDETFWELLLPVPPELTEAYWNGGGHNSTGNEAEAMRQWAIDNFADLRAAGTAERTRHLKRERYKRHQPPKGDTNA